MSKVDAYSYPEMVGEISHTQAEINRRVDQLIEIRLDTAPITFFNMVVDYLIELTPILEDDLRNVLYDHSDPGGQLRGIVTKHSGVRLKRRQRRTVMGAVKHIMITRIDFLIAMED